MLLRTAAITDAQRRSTAGKYVHALRPPEVTHAYAIPMFDAREEWEKIDPSDRSEPLAALCVDFVDGDERLLLDAATEDVLAALADALVDCWKERGGWASTPDRTPDQPASGDWTRIEDVEGFFVSDRKVRKPTTERLRAQIESATA